MPGRLIILIILIIIVIIMLKQYAFKGVQHCHYMLHRKNTTVTKHIKVCIMTRVIACCNLGMNVIIHL